MAWDWDPDLPPGVWGPPAPTVGDAVDMHHSVFGHKPGTFLMERAGLRDELIAAILGAIQAGVPVDDAALQRRWGVSVPPGACS